MPLAGSAAVLVAAINAAQAPIRAAAQAKAQAQGALTPAEAAQLVADLEAAKWNAVIAHLVANGQVVILTGVGAPGTGNLI